MKKDEVELLARISHKKNCMPGEAYGMDKKRFTSNPQM